MQRLSSTASHSTRKRAIPRLHNRDLSIIPPRKPVKRARFQVESCTSLTQHRNLDHHGLSMQALMRWLDLLVPT